MFKATPIHMETIYTLVDEEATLRCPDEFGIHRHVPFYFKLSDSGAVPIDGDASYLLEPCPECTYMRSIKARA
jgi:hypothetical protein